MFDGTRLVSIIEDFSFVFTIYGLGIRILTWTKPKIRRFSDQQALVNNRNCTWQDEVVEHDLTPVHSSIIVIV